MTWFKVDDSFHSHPKVLAVSPAALGLWVVAGSWSGANLSDGFIPDHVLPRLLPDSAPLAKELIAAGLWRRARGGHRFHDWAEFNPLSEDVKKDREAARERMRKLRESRRGKPGDNSVDEGKSAGQGRNGSREHKANVRGKFVTPTRPDPNPLKGGSGSGGGEPSATPDPLKTHPYVPAVHGECATCGLPATNRRHIHLVEESA